MLDVIDDLFRNFALDGDDFAYREGGDNIFTEPIYKCVNGPPACTVPGRDKLEGKLSGIPHRFRDNIFVAAGQVKATDYSIERDRGKAGVRMSQNVNDPSMRARGEDDNSFVLHMSSQKSFVHYEWVRLPRLSIFAAPHVSGKALLVWRNARNLAASCAGRRCGGR
jgi:hypothetical protein